MPPKAPRVSKALPSQAEEEERKEKEKEKEKAAEMERQKEKEEKETTAISSVFKDIVSNAKAKEKGTEVPVVSGAGMRLID